MKKVSEARKNLVLDHPFFGVLSLKLELIESRDVKTFETDGCKLWFNPEYANNLNRYELVGVVAHEVLHCAQGHTWRRQTRDPAIWNRACDLAINPILIDAGMVLPAGVLDGSPYQGMSAEEIYDRLVHENQNAPGGQDDEEQDGSDSPDASGCGIVVDSPSPETKADWSVAVLNAAKRAKAMGNLPSGIDRLVEEIKNPAQDWRAILRRFVQTNARHDYSWQQPNSRYIYAGLYLPSLRSENMPPMVVAVDTSGSIDDLTVSQFSSEIRAIVEEVCPEQVYVVYCDAEIQGVDVFDWGEPVTITPKGYGGTDFRPVFDWVRDKDINPSCLVYLTDMRGDFPDSPPEYPVLWGDTTGIFPPPWGETVLIHRN